MKDMNMRQAAKSSSLRRTSARRTPNATFLEDDAEQALKEIVAASGKLTKRPEGQPQDFARKAGDRRSRERR